MSALLPHQKRTWIKITPVWLPGSFGSEEDSGYYCIVYGLNGEAVYATALYKSRKSALMEAHDWCHGIYPKVIIKVQS